jgi:DNA-binding CsgD family transcriptional regulator
VLPAGGTTLLEREAELAALADVLDRLRTQRVGATVLIEGPPGIGKSAVLASALATAADLSVLRARGTELAARLAFGGVRQLLLPAVRELDKPTREAIFEGPGRLAALVLGFGQDEAPRDGLSDPLFGLHWLVSELAEHAPCVLAVDDVHWLDEESGRFIAYLAERMEGLPLVLVATASPSEPGARSEPVEVLSTTGILIRPRPLSAEAVGRIAPSRDAAEAHRATGGNPLLAYELARAPVETPIEEVAPAAVGRGVLARAARVSSDAVTLVRALSLFAQDAGLEDAAGVAELAPRSAAAAADGLMAAQVLAPGERLAFLHPLMRTAVYEQLGTFTRREEHSVAARLLRERGAAVEDIAAHLLYGASEANPENVRVLRQAAEASIRAAAPRAAVRYLQRALDEPIPPGPERFAALHELGRLQGMLGREEAVETLRAALGAASTPLEHADVALDLAVVLDAHARHDDAVAVLVAIAGADLDAERALLVDSALAGCAFWGRDREVFTQTVARLPPDLPGDTPGQRAALKWRAAARLHDGAPLAEVVELAVRSISDEGRFPWTEFASTVADATAELHYIGRFDLVEQIHQNIAESARERGMETEYLGAVGALGAAAHMRGHYLRAEELYRRVADDPACPAFMRAGVRGGLVEVLVFRGKLEEAEAVFDGLDRAAFWPEWLAVRRVTLAEARGDHSGYEAYRALVDRGTALGQTNPVTNRWLCNYAEGLGRHDRAAEGIALMEDYLAQARGFGEAAPIGNALLSLGRLERGAAAIARLEEAVAVLEPSPHEWLHGWARCELGAALRRDGQRVAGREHLRLAADYAARHGVGTLADAAAEELRLAGARPRNVYATGAEALTPAELRVARLAAYGKTNKEIAAELFLTVGTVQMTLVKAFRKLDVKSRKDLPEALTQPPTAHP